MTLQAPSHAQRLGFIDHRHLINRTVTAVATYTTIDVNRMVKISVVRQLVNSDPLDRKACFPAFLNRSQTWTIRFYFSLTVTIDTGLRVGKIGMPSDFYKTVAITTIHPKLLDMDRMRKGNRLIRLITNASVLGSKVVPNATDDSRSNHCQTNKQFER